MEFSEALRLGGHHWDSYDQEFDNEVRSNDWVLISRGHAPISTRIVLVFDESFLEIGETAKEAAKQWGREAIDIFDIKFVEDVKEELEEEKPTSQSTLSEEDAEAQYWEDELWLEERG